MLRSLELVEVGPAPRLRIDLGPRLNVLAGDNGLGKSFVLEALWWALAGTWAELPAWPRPDAAEAEIAMSIEASAQNALFGRGERSNVKLQDSVLRLRSVFERTEQRWEPFPLHFPEAPLPVLVLFARADGSFAVWDPARNHYKLRPGPRWGLSDVETDQDPAAVRRPPAYLFDTKQLWNGLEAHNKIRRCATVSSATG